MNIDKMIERVMEGESPRKVLEAVIFDPKYGIQSPVVQPIPASLHAGMFQHPDFEVVPNIGYRDEVNALSIRHRTQPESGEVSVFIKPDYRERVPKGVGINWGGRGTRPISDTESYIKMMQHAVNLARALADKHGFSYDK